MSELSDRMRRQLVGRSAEASRPVVPPPRTYPRRITLDLTAKDHQALKLAAVQHDTTMADLLRGLVALWRTDPVLAQRVYQEHQKHGSTEPDIGHRSTEVQEHRTPGPCCSFGNGDTPDER